MEAAFVLFLLALFVWMTVRNVWKAAKGDDLSILPRVENEFQALVVNSELPEQCFDGRTAEIVDDHQEGLTDSETGSFTLHRIHRFARNARGEYFFFISDGSGRPFFKHVSQVNAKIALGKKYIAPAVTDQS